jgi:8-oxo-(d)GTP phosphatase
MIKKSILKIFFKKYAISLALPFYGNTNARRFEGFQQFIELIPETIKKKKNFCLVTEDVETTLNTIKVALPNIIAGGGIIKNSEGAYLFIFRKNKWDLPKGKLDPGETIKECAVREVLEETGVNISSCDELFETTFHIYNENNVLVLKETHWYAMNVIDEVTLTPQLEEGITALEWIKPDNLDKVLANTYPSVTHLVGLIKKMEPII